MAYLRLLRPHQWVKNVFVFAGLIFGRKLSDPHAVTLALLGFLLLSLVSSVVYILNDVHDREEDRHHPRKRSRPVAAGEVSASAALGLSTARARQPTRAASGVTANGLSPPRAVLAA